jgi:hypothetical protein
VHRDGQAQDFTQSRPRARPAKKSETDRDNSRLEAQGIINVCGEDAEDLDVHVELEQDLDVDVDAEQEVEDPALAKMLKTLTYM